MYQLCQTHNWLINLLQGQWHKFFGHPMTAVFVDDSHQPGLHTVNFTCKECGRSFKKQYCDSCGR